MSLYRIVGWILRVALGFYFRRIERFHVERVPLTGPVLFASNHPNSLTDAFVIGASAGRKVNFVATVQVFCLKPLAWLLKRCGVIPINRLKDDPRAMRSVAQTFEACYRVLESGEAIGIFPEGVTHDDPQLREVKTGAARMALELEHRHEGRLGLQIVPVGLTFSAKELYRSEVLVNFGEPIRVADFLAGYAEQRRASIQRLNAEIEQRIQALMLHLPQLEQACMVDAVKRLYLDRLRLGNLIIQEPVSRLVEELVLTQAIASAVAYAFEVHPDRAARFVRQLDRYERWLKRLGLRDEAVRQFSGDGISTWRILSWACLALLGAPIALYGWAHRLMPVTVVRWSVNRFANVDRHKAQTSTAAILTGIASFGLFYAAFIWVFHRWQGWPATAWYASSLPVAGLIAHYYVRDLRRLVAASRTSVVLFRLAFARGRLVGLRSKLIAEIEDIRQQYRRERLSTAPH